MIYDNIENIEKYFGISNELRTIYELVKRNHFEEFSQGSYVVSDLLYYNVDSYVGRDRDNIKFEGHYKYMDVQYIVNNEEYMDFSNEKNVETIEINREKDIYFCDVKDYSTLHVKKGDFVIFFPGELHKPTISVNPRQIKKVVFKILISSK